MLICGGLRYVKHPSHNPETLNIVKRFLLARKITRGDKTDPLVGKGTVNGQGASSPRYFKGDLIRGKLIENS